MSRYAVVNSATGLVINLIELDPAENDWHPDDGYTAVEIPDGVPVDFNWIYDAGTKTFAEPPS
jgi:hypothetical protein